MKTISGLALLVAFCVLSPAGAQELPEFPKPQKEHEWLQKFVGEWESESEMTAESGQQGLKCTGSTKSRTLGGFWIISDVKNDNINAVQTIGYDPEAKQYVGTWVDSMFNHLWKYTGTVDETGKKLTLEAEGPNFIEPGKTAKFQDTYEFKDNDHVVTTSSMQGEDGKWVTFMTGNMRRKK